MNLLADHLSGTKGKHLWSVMKTVFVTCSEKPMITRELVIKCICSALEISRDVKLKYIHGAPLRF